MSSDLSRSQLLGFTRDESARVSAQFVFGTDASPDRTARLFQVSMDLARLVKVSMEEAASVLVYAEGRAFGPLHRLGLHPRGTGDYLDWLEAETAGQAASYAKTIDGEAAVRKATQT